MAPPKVVDQVKDKEHKYIETIDVWKDPNNRPCPRDWLGSVPAGYRPFRDKEIPHPVQVRANELQPKHGGGKIELGKAQIEEYHGKLYAYVACNHIDPPPLHTSVSVFVQLPLLPEEISGGNGSSRNPYAVSPTLNAGNGRSFTRSFKIQLPLMAAEFRINLTNSQLSEKNIEETRSELKMVLSAAIIRRAEEKGINPERPGFLEAMDRAVAKELDTIAPIAGLVPRRRIEEPIS